MRTEQPLKEQSLETVAYRMNQLERTVSEHNHSHFGSGSQSGEIVDGFLRSSDYVEGSSGWMIGGNDNCEFNSGTFRGSLVAGSIHIPDQDTTANSFHTDGDGNSWWGCTETDFNSNNDNANAYILKDGTAKFQSATVSGYFNISSNDMDDVSDGTTYGKVKLTQISAGEIVLANVSGDLDDVSDGSTYAKSTPNQNTGGSRAYSGIDASGNFSGAINPSNNAPASGAGLYLGADYMGYYDSSNWKTYMDSSGNFYLGGSSGSLQWTAGTDTLLVEGTIRTGNSGKYLKMYESSGEGILEYFYGGTSCGYFSVYRTDGGAGTDILGYQITGGGGAIVQGYGRANDGYSTFGIYYDSDSYGKVGVSWAGGDPEDIYITLSARNNSGTYTLPFNDDILPHEDATFSYTYDLGSSTQPWNDLHLNGNIIVSGNVDGVDISAHDANSSAHHTKYSDSDARSAVTGTALPGSLLSGDSTYDLGSSTYPWDNVYADSWYFPNGDVVFDYNSGFTARVIVHKHLKPDDAASNLNIGDSTDYWNEIFYKYLTDVGCLGWFEDGVELQNGEVVSDIEALKSIKKHPKKKTRYGVPQLDYKTMPKSVYRKPETEDGEDGASLDALVGIMLGAIKELDYELTQLKNENKKLLQKVN